MAWLQGLRCSIQFDAMVWSFLSTKGQSTLDHGGDEVVGSGGMVGQI